MSHKIAKQHFPNQPIHGHKTKSRCHLCEHPGFTLRKVAGGKEMLVTARAT